MAVFTDDFNRADDPAGLGAGWAPGYGGTWKVGVSGGQVYQTSGTSGAEVMARRSGESFGGDCFAEVEIGAAPNSNNTWLPGPAVKISSSGFSFYGVSVDYTGSVKLDKTGTTVLTIPGGTFAPGDVYRLEWIQATTVLTVKLNGTVIGTHTDASSPLTGTQVGLYSRSFSASETAWRLDNFAGGDLVSSGIVDLAGAATAVATATGALQGTSALGGDAQAVATAGAALDVTAAVGTITIAGWVNNTGSDLSGQGDINVAVYDLVTRQLVALATGLTVTDGSVSFSDAAIVAGTTYRVLADQDGNAVDLGCDYVTAA